MCAPAMAAVGAIANISGSVIGAAGAGAQTDAQAQQAEYNAKVARINARSSRFEGQAAREAAGPKQEALRGAGIAAAGKNNVDPFFGSAMAIFENNETNYTMDQNNRYLAAESQAVGNENKARDLEAQAAAIRASKKTLQASSILSGLAQASGTLAGSNRTQGAQGGALFLNG